MRKMCTLFAYIVEAQNVQMDGESKLSAFCVYTYRKKRFTVNVAIVWSCLSCDTA